MMNTTQDMSRTQETIKQYLANNTLVEFGGGVTEDTDLFKARLIDSYGYVELVQFLEREFHIHFTDEELISNKLNTLNNISIMVQGKVDAG